MLNTVDGLARADAVGVIHELQERLPAAAAHLLELAAVPSLPLPAERNALRESSVPKNLCRGRCFLGGE